MKNNPNRPYELNWEKLSPGSQALGEGLRRLKEKLAPKAPLSASNRRYFVQVREWKMEGI